MRRGVPSLRSSQRAQRGWLLVEAMLALVISVFLLNAAISDNLRTDLMRSADAQADVLHQLAAGALQAYVDDNYIELQTNLPVTRNGVTLPVGAAVGQSLRPTIAQLQAMNYLDGQFVNNVWLRDGGGIDFLIQQVATAGACPGIRCNINGLAYFTTPFLVRGTEATTRDMDDPIVGQMLSRLGGMAGVSMPGASNFIMGVNGANLAVNPVAGTPPGVVGVAFGYVAGTNGNFVRMGEIRNVPLAANLTVGGDATVVGKLSGDTVIPTGTYVVGAACPDQGAIAQGVVGTAVGEIVCYGGVWRPMAMFATLGGACVNGTTATGAPPTNIGLLCVNNIWRGMDTIIITRTEGAACPTEEGKPAQTADGKELICKNGIYWSTASLAGAQGLVDVNVYAHGSTIPAFACSGGLYPKVVPMGVVSACSLAGAGSNCTDNFTGAFRASITPSMMVSITGSDGVTLAGGNTAQLTVARICSTTL